MSENELLQFLEETTLRLCFSSFGRNTESRDEGEHDKETQQRVKADLKSTMTLLRSNVVLMMKNANFTCEGEVSDGIGVAHHNKGMGEVPAAPVNDF